MPVKVRMSKLLLVAAVLGCLNLAKAAISSNDIAKSLQANEKEIDRYLDRQLQAANQQRADDWKRDFSSPQAYEASVAPWRDKLWRLLGGDNYPRAPLEATEELIQEFPSYRAYKVWIRVFEDVRVYGILLLPKSTGVHPALICVHGMAGTPEHVCGLAEKIDYHKQFGQQAAEQGYIVFAPQNVNSQKGRTWLDRKAILAGQRLQALEQAKFSRVVDYLVGRRGVDPKRIGAYGISWGGRTVMYGGALDKRVVAVVISGHFNDFLPKMVQPSEHYTAFINTAEDYAFFYDHIRQFNDVDIVSLICPRPVFIEQGRQDRVAWWEISQKAFGEVQSIYRKLGIEERAAYSIFEGPHEVHGVEAFKFLARWLRPDGK